MLTSTRMFAALALAAAVGAAPACAARVNAYRDDRPYAVGASSGVERIARENGYHEGREAGVQDARRGRSFDVDRHGDFRQADKGYRRDFGDRAFYRREFRDGYRTGYSEAYRAYTRGR